MVFGFSHGYSFILPLSLHNPLEPLIGLHNRLLLQLHPMHLQLLLPPLLSACLLLLILIELLLRPQILKLILIPLHLIISRLVKILPPLPVLLHHPLVLPHDLPLHQIDRTQLHHALLLLLLLGGVPGLYFILFEARGDLESLLTVELGV